jgi:competence protein ComEA
MREGALETLACTLALALLLAALPASPNHSRPPAVAPPAAGAARLLWGLALDLNREDARSLEALPGIGPIRARAIVAARPFCHPRELLRVPGIGPVILRGLAERVEVRQPPASCGH